MLEFLREYQLNIMLILIGVCGLLAFLVLLTKAIPLKRRFILMAMELCAMFLLIADRYSYIYRGDISDLGYWMVRICNFGVYLMTLFILVIFSLYLGNLCLNEVGLKVLPKRMQVAHLLLLTVIWQYRNGLTKGVRLSLILFTCVPFLASLGQIYAYGLSLTNIRIKQT